jgi:hypothetical protein
MFVQATREIWRLIKLLENCLEILLFHCFEFCFLY